MKLHCEITETSKIPQKRSPNVQKPEFSWLDIAVKTRISVKTTLLSTPWNATISRINSHKIRINSKRQLTLWKIKMSSEGSAHEIVQKQNTNFVRSTLDFCNMQKKLWFTKKTNENCCCQQCVSLKTESKGGCEPTRRVWWVSANNGRAYFVRSFDAKLRSRRKRLARLLLWFKNFAPWEIGSATSKNENDNLCKNVVKWMTFDVVWRDFFSGF